MRRKAASFWGKGSAHTLINNEENNHGSPQNITRSKTNILPHPHPRTPPTNPHRTIQHRSTQTITIQTVQLAKVVFQVVTMAPNLPNPQSLHKILDNNVIPRIPPHLPRHRQHSFPMVPPPLQIIRKISCTGTKRGSFPTRAYLETNYGDDMGCA